MANIKPKSNGSIHGSQAEQLSEVTVLNKKAPPASRKKKVLQYSAGNNHHQYNDELDTRYLLQLLTEVKNGNFNVRMPIDRVGLTGKICDTLNEIISTNERM